MPCSVSMTKPGECQECRYKLGAQAMSARGAIGPAHHETHLGSFCATHCRVHRNAENGQQKSLIIETSAALATSE